MAVVTKTVIDLQNITGLKEQYAKECFSTFGSYGPALASFAQSYSSLTPDYFANPQTAKNNAKSINDELRHIYRRARELKAKLGKQDKDVWQAYGTPEPAPAATPVARSDLPSSPATAAPAKQTPFSFAPPTKAPTAPAIFGFGSATPSSNAAVACASPPIFGFGQPTPAIAEAAPAQPSAFSFGHPAAPAVAVKEKKKPLKYIAAPHFVGPYLDMPHFWEAEVLGKASLFNLDKGYLESHKDELRPMMSKWLAKASFYRKPVQYVDIEDEDEEVVRVIIKDSDRTFFHPDHRKKLVNFLHAMYHEFNAYGQAMSYLAGLCMIALTEEETAAIIRFVATAYIKGHWAAEAVGFATSAWVVEHFMQKQFPVVATHLLDLNIWPDTYLQKILTGLCIHVLNFHELFIFLNTFMEDGMAYLIRFCLAMIEHFHDDILALKSNADANHLYEMMRLDPRVVSLGDVHTILARAPHVDLGEAGSNIDVIRMEVYEKRVGPRLQLAPKTETFEPCEICDANRPKWWNEDLGAVCDACMVKHPEATFDKY